VNKVVAYHRWENGGEGDDVVVIANFGGQAFDDYTIGLPKPGMWKVRFNSSSQLYDPHIDNFETLDTEAIEGECDGHPWCGTLGLGSYAFVVLSQ
jgi:1,4-alpha-glucan branching enzyme